MHVKKCSRASYNFKYSIMNKKIPCILIQQNLQVHRINFYNEPTFYHINGKLIINLTISYIITFIFTLYSIKSNFNNDNLWRLFLGSVFRFMYDLYMKSIKIIIKYNHKKIQKLKKLNKLTFLLPNFVVNWHFFNFVFIINNFLF